MVGLCLLALLVGARGLRGQARQGQAQELQGQTGERGRVAGDGRRAREAELWLCGGVGVGQAESEIRIDDDAPEEDEEGTINPAWLQVGR